MSKGVARCHLLQISVLKFAQNAKARQSMTKKTAKKDAAQGKAEKPEEILVVALKETPERVIDKMRSRRYPKSWRGKLPSDLAETWKAKGYVRFASDMPPANPPAEPKDPQD